MKSIDVIIPYFNKKYSIKKCLKSLENQKIKFNNIIIINDGSDKSSYQIIKELIRKKKNIKLFNFKKNKGVSQARNFGMKVAKSEYITFLDADDELGPQYLSQIQKLINNNISINVFSTRHINFYSSIKFKYKNDELNKIDEEVIKYPLLRSSFQKDIYCASGITFKKKFILKYKFPIKAKLGEDIYVWQNIFSNNEICISNDIQIKINKNAENRSEKVQNEIPYYIIHNNLNKKKLNFIQKFSFFLFYLTSLFIVINKKKIKNDLDIKEFNYIVSKQTFFYKIVAHLSSLYLLTLFYLFYIKIKSIFININFFSLLIYFFIMPTVSLIFFVFYLKKDFQIANHYLLSSTFILIILSLLSFHPRVFLKGQIKSFNTILSQINLRYFVTFYGYLIFFLFFLFFNRNENFELFFFAFGLLSYFWFMEMFIFYLETTNQFYRIKYWLLNILIVYLLIFSIPTKIITNQYLILILFIIQSFVFYRFKLILNIKKFKNLYSKFFNNEQTKFFLFSTILFLISNFIFRYNINNFNNISYKLTADFLILISFFSFPSTLYVNVFAQNQFRANKIIIIFGIIIFIFLLIFLLIFFKKFSDPLVDTYKIMCSVFIGSIILFIGNFFRQKIVFNHSKLYSLLLIDFFYCIQVVIASIITILFGINYYYLIPIYISLSSLIYFYFYFYYMKYEKRKN